MTRIIDNDTLLLTDLLQESLPLSRRMDACVGYFNLRGWGELYDSLHQMEANELDIPDSPRVRLIVGMALTGEEQVKQTYDISRAQQGPEEPNIQKKILVEKRLLEGFAKQLMWGVPDYKSRKSLNNLLADLRSGFLQVSVVTRAPLHGKLYITHTVDGFDSKRAVVGSSNFTPSGLKVNGELNLLETDTEIAEKLYRWFENQWEDQFTADITQQLIELLEDSWANDDQPSPRDVHLKMAYELSRDARVGKNTSIPSNLADILMPWQTDAVKIAARILETKNLVVVGDVVGLGKTLVATALAATRDEAVLVICPKNLVEMWQETMEDYELAHKVVSLSMTKDLEDLRRYKLVIVDESHNLRNQTQSWGHVRDYVQLNDSKVILLTATMFNADHSDIAEQLSLKLPEHLDLGIRPEKLIDFLPEHEYELGLKVDGPLTSLSAFRKSWFTEDWQRLISQFMVRRTRTYIKERYGITDKDTGEIFFEFSNGERFSFPERVTVPLEYLGGDNDPGDQLASIENFDALADMNYARYSLGTYLLKDIEPSPSQKQLIDDLKRAIAAQGFIRTTILKRLASSPKAFFITVEKMLFRAWILTYALENNLSIPVGAVNDAAYALDEELIADGDGAEVGDDQLSEYVIPSEGSWAVGVKPEDWRMKAQKAYENLLATKPRGLRWADIQYFDRDTLLSKVQEDNKVLQAIIDRHGDWDVANDTKLNALAQLVNSRPLGKKTLIFSEYKDTIDYLNRHLPRLCPNLVIEAVSGNTHNPTEYARRFAPEANIKHGGIKDGEVEIDVLLATDVLSEGQNLQDSDAVVNWDLPWTIIRVIQRAGRVDRVGQKAKQISVHSFMPQNKVENVIRLIQRLRKRLNENQRLFGGGEQFLNDQGDEAENIEDLFNRETPLGDYEGDVDYGSYALGIWDSATDAERKKIVSLPFGLHSTKTMAVAVTSQSMAEKSGVLVHAVAENQDIGQVDHIAFGDLDSGAKTLTQLEALKMTSCDAGEVALPMIPTHFAIAERLVNSHIYQQANNKAVNNVTGLKGKLYNILKEAMKTLFTEDDLFVAQNRQIVDNIQTDLLRYPILEASKRNISEIVRAHRRVGLNQTTKDIIELYESSQMFDTSSSELTNLILVASMGLKK
jgi:superfamily II DNA or RNA helicase